MLAGRNFSNSIKTDDHAVIVNEAAARLLGFEDPSGIVNESLKGLESDVLGSEDSRIIGVIRNYHQRSLKNNFEPMVFVLNRVYDFGCQCDFNSTNSVRVEALA